MYPCKLSKIPPSLRTICESIILEKDGMTVGLPPGLLYALTDYMELINSYYTNAMEGNRTTVRDIENALAGKFLDDRIARNWQLEHLAHIKVEKEITDLMQRMPETDPTTPAFLTLLHQKFFSSLPEDMRFALSVSGEKFPFEPGALRNAPVTVGRHIPPQTRAEIERFLSEFHRNFTPASRIPTVEALIHAAIAHHRFLWIHPFTDGNGRVVRLFSNAYLWKIGISSSGRFWSIARGLGRQRRDYDAFLASADLAPRNSYDGRGPLSEEETIAFCQFYLETALDQIRFMTSTIEAKYLLQRLDVWLQVQKKNKQLSKSAVLALQTLFNHQYLSIQDLAGILKLKERGLRNVINELLTKGLAQRENQKAPLRLKLNVNLAEAIIPRLV